MYYRYVYEKVYITIDWDRERGAEEEVIGRGGSRGFDVVIVSPQFFMKATA